MTTKSTVAQMLVAERVRQLQEESVESVGKDGGEDASEGTEPAIFQRHSDKWYYPDSRENKYAVKNASGGGRKYYKTVDGAAARLRKEYE